MIGADGKAITEGNGVRVAMVSSVHRWNDTRIFIKEAASLAGKGYHVVLTGVGAEPSPFMFSGVRVYPLPKRPRVLRWINWLSVLRIIVAERATVVHAHDPELFPLVLLLKPTGRKVICDIHEDFGQQVLHKEWLPRFLVGALSKAIRAVEKWLPRLADAVILAEDSYQRNFPQGTNITVIRNFPVLSPQYKRDYSSEVFRLVYVGDVRKIRGIGEYVAISEQLIRRGVPAELWVIGSFADTSEEKEIKSLVRRLGIENSVVFFGRRPPEEIPPLLEQCDVGLTLLHPIGNYRESYPTKMFEYMAAGLPVVASRFALWERVLVGNDCGRVADPLDLEEATSFVLEYWNSRELRERHGRNGRSAVVQRYHWDLELQRLTAVYSALT